MTSGISRGRAVQRIQRLEARRQGSRQRSIRGFLRMASHAGLPQGYMLCSTKCTARVLQQSIEGLWYCFHYSGHCILTFQKTKEQMRPRPTRARQETSKTATEIHRTMTRSPPAKAAYIYGRVSPPRARAFIRVAYHSAVSIQRRQHKTYTGI